MNQHKNTFALNNQEQFAIQTTEPIENLHCCSQVPIVFKTDNISYTLCNDSLMDNLEDFGEKLEKALHNQLQLHDSIKENLGYSLNQDGYYSGHELGPVPGLFYDKNGPYPAWIGLDYLLVDIGGYDRIVTWLYNNKAGDIILEITPSYPWYIEDAEKDPRYTPYDEWIKTYKPYVVRTIPKDTAEQWLQQVNDILKTINENIARNLTEETENNEK